MSLLLVDDRPENLLALRAILDSPGYRLVEARSGPEALRAVERDEFALILLDVAMPGMTGFEVADRLKREPRTTRIPILFLTAVATGLDEIYRAYTIGAVDYLIKPLDVGAVRAKVAVFADLHRQRLEIQRQARALHEAERREHAVRMAELRVASEARYRKLVEGIDHAFAWEADAEAQRLSFVSQRATEMLGYPLEAFARPGFFLDAVHPDDREAVRKAIGESVAHDRDGALNHRIVGADGAVRWFHTGFGCTVSDDTGCVQLHGLSVDVTELQEATQARDHMLRVVSHDLRNPLGAILLTAMRLRQGLAQRKDGEQLAGMAGRIERAATTMQRLVEDLLDWERMRAGRMSLSRRPCPVEKLLADAAALAEPIATAKSVEVRIDPEPAAGACVLCDDDRIQQVLSNLLANAIRLSPAQARVEVTASPRDDGGPRVCFAVRDHGPGIEAARLPSLFDATWPSAATPLGLGLGLSIARGIVEAHEGRIWAESEPGSGSTFFFTLPVASAEGSAHLA